MKTETKRNVFIEDDEISDDEIKAAIDNEDFEKALRIVDSISDPTERARQRKRILDIKKGRG